MRDETKILLYDIETAPSIGAYFQFYKEGNIVWTEKHWHLLSFAYKWLDEKKTSILALPDFQTYKKEPENDKLLVKELWNLFNKADIIIAHHGVAFDTKKSNARFIYHGFPPPEPYKEVDTRKVAKQYFKFDSNKLDDLGDYLKIGRKLRTGGFELWRDCLKGDLKAWDRMKKYNKQDVILLEKIYLKLRPYIRNHPNRALIENKKIACPNCGSHKLRRQGFHYTRVNVLQKYQCLNCYSWHSSPIPKFNKIPQVR